MFRQVVYPSIRFNSSRYGSESREIDKGIRHPMARLLMFFANRGITASAIATVCLNLSSQFSSRSVFSN